MNRIHISCPVFVLVFAAAFSAGAWPTVYPTGTTLYDPEKTENGYVLFAPLDDGEGGDTGVLYLINMNGQVAHQWSVPFTPLQGRLLPSGNVVIIGRNNKGATKRPGVGKYHIGGASGWLVELDWDGKLVFKHVDLAMHHDFAKLPNGNYLYLAWEPVPPELCKKIRGGIKGTEFENGVMFNDKLVEIDPQGKVVWEWRANEHLDPDLDIVGPMYKREEWYHGNSVCVLSDGHIALSGRFTDSLLVIDRRTGKIILRWGNAAYLDKKTGRIEYRTGTEVLGGPHDVREIPAGYPGAGNLTCYDNGTYTSASRVVEIDRTGKLVWQSSDPRSGRKHYSYHLAGAERLRNGNTLVCDGANGRFFQVTKDGRVAWEYINPFIPSPKYQGAVFNVHFYGHDYCRQFQGLPSARGPAVSPPSALAPPK
jgi:outer membrane protein assembly factor BamB